MSIGGWVELLVWPGVIGGWIVVQERMLLLGGELKIEIRCRESR